jgi:hypothetical protein
MSSIYDKFTDVTVAALNLTLARLHHQRHPQDQAAKIGEEVAEEQLYEACQTLLDNGVDQEMLMTSSGECVGYITTEESDIQEIIKNWARPGSLQKIEEIYERFPGLRDKHQVFKYVEQYKAGGIYWPTEKARQEDL